MTMSRRRCHPAVISSEIPFHAEGRHPRSLMGKNFRSYLLDLRSASTPFRGVRKALIDTLLDGYETARYGTGVSGVAARSLGTCRAPDCGPHSSSSLRSLAGASTCATRRP